MHALVYYTLHAHDAAGGVECFRRVTAIHTQLLLFRPTCQAARLLQLISQAAKYHSDASPSLLWLVFLFPAPDLLLKVNLLCTLQEAEVAEDVDKLLCSGCFPSVPLFVVDVVIG